MYFINAVIKKARVEHFHSQLPWSTYFLQIWGRGAEGEVFAIFNQIVSLSSSC